MRKNDFLVFLCSVLYISSLFAAPVAHASVGDATTYLHSHATSAWAIMALSAAGESPDTTPLQQTSGSTAIELEAPVLALTAAHQDPSSYPTTNLIEKLNSFYKDGQLGDSAALNDDIFGALALVSAGTPLTDTTLVALKSYINTNQNSDGGWPFSVGGTSDTNTTAAAIMALIALGSSPNSTAVTQGLAYLHTSQNTDGGFPYDPKSSWGTSSDASSDAWVLMALTASGVDESSWATASGTPKTDLLTYQTADGSFEFQHGTGADSFTPVTTSYAVLALSGKTLPVATLTPPQAPEVPASTPTPTPPPPAPAPVGGGGGAPISGPLSVGYVAVPASTTPILVASTTQGVVLGTSTEAVTSASSTPPSVASTTTSSPSYTFTYNLKYGMQDGAVGELQKLLIAHQLLNVVAPTGWFGPRTLAAVKVFQGQNEIPATGFVGPMTRGVLNEWK
jgi:peptidoglycan hydrolase-like protein with peptidoglycan-binding domain